MDKIKNMKLGKLLKEKAPKVLDVVGDLLPDQGALGIVKRLIDDPDITPISPEEKQELNNQLMDIYKLEVADRDSARKRQSDMIKAGAKDWLFNVTGLVGLAAFGFLVLSIVFLEVPATNKEIFIHLIGIVEGVALSIFGYYFGAAVKSDK
jgi:hypothetical protein|tara:strand:+ start:429 stop:881 length:453 start_codon:yes stop_codon:yes gene_type:complete